MKVVTDEIYFNLKNATDEEKQRIKKILVASYECIVDEMLAYAPYGNVSGGKSGTPVNSKKLSCKAFIKKYSYWEKWKVLVL